MKGVRRTIRRRRLEAKTDYKARLSLLKARKPRIVVRKTNRYIIAQLVSSDIAQDKVHVTVSSKDLLAKGWPKEHSGSLKSLVASYFTGILLAQAAKGIFEEAIVDMGMHRNAKGGRVYALVKGLIDGGMKVPANASALPDEKRLEENKKTRETYLTLKQKLNTHGRTRNKE